MAAMASEPRDPQAALQQLEQDVEQLAEVLNNIVQVDKRRYSQCLEASGLEKSRRVRAYLLSYRLAAC